ncbi:MAG: DUF4167 domain-containing protein [Rhizobiaceae bacterium]|nr:DUF4167 domain-containing protein [Rhizobiaceae bacterium]
MRPQQQNRRMRGRNNGGGNNNNNNNHNNNRKGPNPLTRNYESNGPDVKIRGSAQQIAEKYATLARDASSAGDRVMAENYLQHAEHYNRIIAAAQAQFASQQVHVPREEIDDDLDEGYGFESNGAAAGHEVAQQPSPQPAAAAADGSGPQPVIEGVPAEVALNSEPVGQPTGGGRHRERRQHRNDHHNRNGANGAAVAPAIPVEAVAEQPAESSEPVTLAEAAPAEETPAPRRPRRPRRSARDRVEAEDQPSADAESSGELTGSEG